MAKQPQSSGLYSLQKIDQTITANLPCSLITGTKGIIHIDRIMLSFISQQPNRTSFTVWFCDQDEDLSGPIYLKESSLLINDLGASPWFLVYDSNDFMIRSDTNIAIGGIIYYRETSS